MKNIHQFLDSFLPNHKQQEREDLQYHMEEMIEELVREGRNLRVAINQTVEAFSYNDEVKDYLKQTETARPIRRKELRFEDILKLDEFSVRLVIEKTTDTELLVIALKNCTEGLKNKILRNMSEYRKILFDELEKEMYLPKLRDIEEAQQMIVNNVLKMEKCGMIIIQRGEEDVVV